LGDRIKPSQKRGTKNETKQNFNDYLTRIDYLAVIRELSTRDITYRILYEKAKLAEEREEKAKTFSRGLCGTTFFSFHLILKIFQRCLVIGGSNDYSIVMKIMFSPTPPFNEFNGQWEVVSIS
jgi:hypothetical protein